MTKPASNSGLPGGATAPLPLRMIPAEPHEPVLIFAGLPQGMKVFSLPAGLRNRDFNIVCFHDPTDAPALDFDDEHAGVAIDQHKIGIAALDDWLVEGKDVVGQFLQGAERGPFALGRMVGQVFRDNFRHGAIRAFASPSQPADSEIQLG